LKLKKAIPISLLLFCINLTGFGQTDTLQPATIFRPGIIIDIDGLINGSFISNFNDESVHQKYKAGLSYSIESNFLLKITRQIHIKTDLNCNNSFTAEKLKTGQFLKYIDYEQVQLKNELSFVSNKHFSIGLHYDIYTNFWKVYKYELANAIYEKKLNRYFKNPITKEFNLSVGYRVNKNIKLKAGLAGGRIIKMNDTKLFEINKQEELFGLTKEHLRSFDLGFHFETNIDDVKLTKTISANFNCNMFIAYNKISFQASEIQAELKLKQQILKNLVILYAADFLKYSYLDLPVIRTNIGIAYSFLLRNRKK
jgi:hypothetical protein